MHAYSYLAIRVATTDNCSDLERVRSGACMQILYCNLKTQDCFLVSRVVGA